ncbi:MAG: hypothetical protein QXQ02_05945 [Halobacteria archaeon]
MAIRVEIKIEFRDKKLKTTALVNTGFETPNPQLLLPVKAAQELNLWPDLPREASIDTYDTAGGPMRVYIVPNAGKVSILDRESESCSPDIVISHTEVEVLISDKLASQLKIVIEDPGEGIWRFRDESPGTFRKSKPPKYFT